MSSYLLIERHNDNKASSNPCPRPAEHRPRLEPAQAKHVHTEHGSRPDADKERGEEESGNVGGDLGGAELADDDFEGRAVVEVGAFFQVQLTLE